MNPNEADDFKWIDKNILNAHMKKFPDLYTPWFYLIMKEIALHNRV